MPSLDAKRARHGVLLAPIVLLGAVGLLAPTRAAAHFKITDPTTPPKAATVQSWLSQDMMGSPQKNGPCAAVPNATLEPATPGTPVANAVTVVQPGQTVTVPVTVTVGHPGWFRIALAQGASSTQTLTALPDPKAQTGTNCTPAIMTNPVWSPTQPVLADGLPAGSTVSTQQTGSKTFQVTIPSNASCSTAQPCSLQVIMVMTDHPANDCYYHHCADVVVASGATGSGGSSGSGGAAATGGAGGRGAGGSGSGGTGTGGTASGGSPGTGGGTASGGSPGQGGSTGTSSGGSPGTGGGTETGGTGVSASGGAGGSGPSTGTGGASGATGQSGGSTGQSGGSTGSGGTSAQAGSSGCSCAVAGHSRSSWAFGAAGVLALVIARRRRR